MSLWAGGSVFWIVIPLGVLLGIAILAVANGLAGSEKPLRRSLGRGTWIAGWTIIAFALIFRLNVFGLLVLVVVAMVLRQLRRARQQSLLWTLAMATERSIPLGPVVEAFAEEQSGPARHKIRTLARLLQSSASLPDALAAVGGMESDGSLTPIQVGQELGVLDEGLRQVAAPAGPHHVVLQHLTGKLAYLTLLLAHTAGIVVFLTWRIEPAFSKIFADFDAELPAMSWCAIGLGSQATGTLLGGIGFVFFWLLVYAVLRSIGAISWDLPLLGRLGRKLHVARVLESLAMAVERGQPLVKAIAVVARFYPRRSIYRPLRAALVDVTGGADWAESLRVRGLISRADAAVLHAAQRAGNLAWAMREIADSNRRRLGYRIQAWMQVLFPAAILCFGVVVLWLVVAYFVPLVALIQQLG